MIKMITGVAGFIGFHLANQLLDRGDKVIGIDNLSNYYDVKLKKDRLNILKKYKNFTFKQINIVDSEKIKKCFKENNISIVCHLAAQAGVRYSLENPREYINTNLIGHFNILENCKNFNVKNILYASSSSVYGGNTKVPFSEKDRVEKPVSLYASTKRSDELLSYTYSHLYKINTIGLRFFTVYGPWGRPDMATWIFTENILKGEPIRVFNNGMMKRDFTYIDDIIAGTVNIIDYMLSNNKNTEAKIYNLGNSNPVNLLDFINVIEKYLGKKAVKSMDSLQLGDVVETFADISQAKSDFKFSPSTPITKGIPKFIEWYLKYNKI